MANDTSYIIVNGTLQPYNKPFASTRSRGLMYGDGCFETCCAYEGQYFRLDDHLSRLKKGLDYLAISYPDKLQKDRIGALLKRLLSKNNLERDKAIIRMQVWRQGRRGYASTSRKSGYMITASAGPKVKNSYRLRTVSTKRIPSVALPSQFKFSNGINYIKAASQAWQQGGDDALMETVHGWVSETTIANVFWMQDDAVFTPSQKCDILPGITRKTVIDLLNNKLNMQVCEGEYSIEDIKSADCAWICNSVKGVASVAEIDDIQFDTEASVIEELQEVYKSYRNQQLQSLT